MDQHDPDPGKSIEFVSFLDPRFVIPETRFDDLAFIEARVAQVPEIAQGSVRTALSYLFLLEGPINLPPDRFDMAEPLLEPAERLLARWLRTRTNGKLRKTYGAEALREARHAHYRCRACGYADVRALHLDHVDGKVPGTPFACLCANCHNIKSREKDWTGRARESAIPAGGEPA